MRHLAKQTLKSLKNNRNQQTYLYLNLVAQQYTAGHEKIKALRQDYKKVDPNFAPVRLIQYELYMKAQQKSNTLGISFNTAFQQSFLKAVHQLSFLASSRTANYLLHNDLPYLKNQLQASLQQFKDQDSIPQNSALQLCRQYAEYKVYHAIMPLAKPLIDMLDAQHYIIQKDLLITSQKGVKLHVIVVRKKQVKKPLPAILQFTIYARMSDVCRAKEAAARGYVGVIAYSRGKGLSPGKTDPYEHEAKDTHTVIDWISKQPWNNQQVGMYGGSYVGFSQWAATKKLHPALKTIVTAASVAPGLDAPMENNVSLNFIYNWVPYVTNNKYLDNDTYYDNSRWNNLLHQWYNQGKPYKDLEKIDGQPNPIFRRWLAHPGYDAYWQSMIPYQKEFARIKIPILSTTGYYDGGQIGELYYLKEHYKYNPQAEHYFLIGPYTHFGAQTIPINNVGGYDIDPVARINIHELIFKWLDYIFKKGKKPAILKDKINYQVMGTNEWKHASSLDKMNNDTLKLYLNNAPLGVRFSSAFGGKQAFYTLTTKQPAKKEALVRTVDFSDRTPGSQHNYFTSATVSRELVVGNGIAFATAPFKKDFIMSGSYLGKLQATINKKDIDCSIILYEQTPEGEYFKLTIRYLGRASYAHNKSQRQLLTPGKKTTIPFDNVRMTARKISKGSRLIMILNVNKHPYDQINYGSGKEVSNESIQDAKKPLKVQWHNDSYIQIPIRKE